MHGKAMAGIEIQALTPERRADFLAFLAYREGQVVGWCNAAPRLMMDAFADEPELQGDAENYYGPLSLYTAAGFEFYRQGEHGCVILRKRLV